MFTFNKNIFRCSILNYETEPFWLDFLYENSLSHKEPILILPLRKEAAHQDIDYVTKPPPPPLFCVKRKLTKSLITSAYSEFHI